MQTDLGPAVAGQQPGDGRAARGLRRGSFGGSKQRSGRGKCGGKHRIVKAGSSGGKPSGCKQARWIGFC
jgi:hypothetical protein